VGAPRESVRVNGVGEGREGKGTAACECSASVGYPTTVPSLPRTQQGLSTQNSKSCSLWVVVRGGQVTAGGGVIVPRNSEPCSHCNHTTLSGSGVGALLPPPLPYNPSPPYTHHVMPVMHCWWPVTTFSRENVAASYT
jgi:hypothetical protein